MKDDLCRRCIAKAPGSAVAWFIMAAYAYYVQDDPILTDGGYESVVSFLEANFDHPKVRAHPHFRLVKRCASLDDGRVSIPSGHEIGPDYPALAVSTVRYLRRS